MSQENTGRSILIGLGLIMGLGVLVGWAAFRTHTRRAITVEGRQQAVTLARGIASCASAAGPDGRPRGLPPTAEPVPPTMASVAARRHASAPAAWSAPAYACAGFAPEAPQLFRLRWERSDDARGAVHAEADLDGDQRPDIAIAQPIVCAPACSLGPLSSIARLPAFSSCFSPNPGGGPAPGVDKRGLVRHNARSASLGHKRPHSPDEGRPHEEALRRRPMPKMKSNRAAKKRVRLTGTGRVRRSKQGGNHGLSNKSRKRLRRLRANDLVDSTMEKRIKIMLPYG